MLQFIIGFLLGMIVGVATARAADMTVNDQDQQNLQAICDVASASPQINRDMRAQIATFCVVWAKRVQDNAKPKETKEPAKEGTGK